MTADLFLVKVGVSPGKRGDADETEAAAAEAEVVVVVVAVGRTAVAFPLISSGP